VSPAELLFEMKHYQIFPSIFGRPFRYSQGHAVAQWLRHCATSRKVAGSILDDVNVLPAALGPGVHSASDRKIMFLGSRARTV
jgi:hypothetical protein